MIDRLLQLVPTLIAVATFFWGVWRGDRMFLLGKRYGREMERRDARHARERIIDDAKLAMCRAALSDHEWDEAYEETEDEGP